MKSISYIIIDDEQAALDVVKMHAGKIKQLQLIRTFHDPVEAFSFLQVNTVDLAFVDINMPKLSGIELARQFGPKTALVFTTAYSEHALEGFEKGAIDYLLKPVSFERFLKAVTKASRFLGKSLHETNTIAGQVYKTKIDGLDKSIPIAEIIYIQSFGNYLKIHLTDQLLLAADTIKNAEAKLQTLGFIRSHRSYLVNTTYVKKSDDQIHLKNGKIIPVGSVYRREVLRVLSADNFN